MKKTLSILVAIVIVICIGTLSVFAAESLTTDDVPNVENWRKGHYSTSGTFQTYAGRACMTKLLSVTPGTEYTFDTGTGDSTYRYVLREFDSNQNFIRSYGALDTATYQITDSTVAYLAVSLYCPGNESVEILPLIQDGTIKPTITATGEVTTVIPTTVVTTTTVKPDDVEVSPSQGDESDDDTIFSSLQEAVNVSMSTGQRYVRLLENVTITEPVTITSGVGFTLDMNGHSITYSPTLGGVYYDQPAIVFNSTNTSSSPINMAFTTQTATADTTIERTDKDGTFVNNGGNEYFFKIQTLNSSRYSRTSITFASGARNFYGDVTVDGALTGGSNGTTNVYGNIKTSSLFTNNGSTMTVYGNITCGRFVENNTQLKVYGYLHDTFSSDPYSAKYAESVLVGKTIFYDTYEDEPTDKYKGFDMYLDGDVKLTLTATNRTVSGSAYIAGNATLDAVRANAAANYIKFSKPITVNGDITGTVGISAETENLFSLLFDEVLTVNGNINIDASTAGRLRFSKGIFSNYDYTDGTNTYPTDTSVIDVSSVVFQNIPSVVDKLKVTAVMKKGAAIRLNKVTGIRYYTTLDTDKIAALKADGATVEMGTLIAPSDLVGENDLTFDLADNLYVNVPYAADEYYTADDFEGIVGSIASIRESGTDWSATTGNITREFIGRGYVKVTQDDVTSITYASYSDNNIDNNTRSLKYVAQSLLDDTTEFGSLTSSLKLLIQNWADSLKTPLSHNQSDTSDFALSSVDMSKKMLIGYNIGDALEGFENRSGYERPDNIVDLVDYKETLWGNVPATEEYIKYLKSIGIQAIRVPITWFPMVEGEDGQTNTEIWTTGKINREWMDRVQEIVDIILENDMYCMINTHHDGSCNVSNPVTPLIFDAAHQESSIAYIKNVWQQIGTRFKNYGSKLLFEVYNEVADSTGQMTPNSTRDAVAAEVTKAFIETVRAIGGNNESRFLVCPRYGGVTIWENTSSFAGADTAEDKLILTMHSYPSTSGVSGVVSGVAKKMNEINVGCIIDEIGGVPANADNGQFAENVRTASDNYGVSCFWWDNGQAEFALVNRYYNLPAGPEALSKYVGHTVANKTFTEAEVLDEKQPYYLKFYSADANSSWAGKYLIVTSEKKVTKISRFKSRVDQGYYSLHGFEGGYFTYYSSDDGINYTLMGTRIATPYSKAMYNDLTVYGTVYTSKLVGGNYVGDVIFGDGTQALSVTGENLFTADNAWVQGAYGTDGVISTSSSTDVRRISLENKIAVSFNDSYMFKAPVNFSNTSIRYQIRMYNSEGTVLQTSTCVNEALTIPYGVTQISVTMYQTSNSYTFANWQSMLESGEIAPSMYLMK